MTTPSSIRSGNLFPNVLRTNFVENHVQTIQRNAEKQAEGACVSFTHNSKQFLRGVSNKIAPLEFGTKSNLPMPSLPDLLAILHNDTLAKTEEGRKQVVIAASHIETASNSIYCDRQPKGLEEKTKKLSS